MICEVLDGAPSAFAVETMNSVGDLISARYASGDVNSGLMNIARISVLVSYFERR